MRFPECRCVRILAIELPMYAYVFPFLTALVWGGEYAVLNELTESLPSVVAMALTFSGAAILTATARALRSGLRPPTIAQSPPVGRRVWADRVLSLLVIGGISAGIQLCTFTGLSLSTATNVATLSRTDILFTLAISAIAVGSRPVSFQWLGVATTVGGILVMLWPSIVDFEYSGLGDLLVLLGALLLSINAFIIKRLARSVDRRTIAIVNQLANVAVASAVVAIVPGERAPIGDIVAVWPYVAVASTLVFFFFETYYVALARLPVWQVRLILLIVPGVASFGEWVLSGAAPSMRAIAGMLLVISGSAMVILFAGGRRR